MNGLQGTLVNLWTRARGHVVGINVEKIIMGCGYCSDLGTISMLETISASCCIEYIVKYMIGKFFS